MARCHAADDDDGERALGHQLTEHARPDGAIMLVGQLTNDEPSRPGFACRLRFAERVRARADRDARGHGQRVPYTDRAARQLYTARACRNSDVDTIGDDEPGSGRLLELGEHARDFVEPRSARTWGADLHSAACA